MSNLNSSIVFRIALFIAIPFVLVACSEDDPVTPPEEHFEAIGVVLKTSGIEVVRIFEGVTSDTLRATQGNLSDHLEVFFLDENQQVLNPPDDSDKKFKAVVDDTGIAEFYQHEGEEGGYEFHIKGVQPGTTFIELFIEHTGHNDFRSGKIPVVVE